MLHKDNITKLYKMHISVPDNLTDNYFNSNDISHNKARLVGGNY
jgi:hypothetical protein